MYCAISGEIPQQPVVSRKTGHLFERRLIEKALQASENRCPVTGEELKPEDLLPVACDLAQRPRPLSATSLPAMLAMFQNEWDDLVVLIAASWGLSEIMRRRRDSPPSHDDVGGFVFNVERVSGEIATRCISHTGRVPRDAQAIARHTKRTEPRPLPARRRL